MRIPVWIAALVVCLSMIQRAHAELILPMCHDFADSADAGRLAIGGYAKLDAIFDFDDAGDRFQFDPRRIPLGGKGNEQTTFHARQSRLNLGYTNDTPYGKLKLFIEGDFFGTGNAFRLRHAYGQWSNWLAGQTWSSLVDTEAFIETLDFAGADGAVNIRRPQLRVELPTADWLQWRLSIEDNTTSLNANVVGQSRNRYPVLATALRVGGEPWHLYWLAGITETRFVPNTGPDQTAFVWVAGLSGKLRLGERDSLVAKCIVGEGIDSLVNVSADTINPIASIDTQLGYFFDMGYQHYWTEALRSNFAFRAVEQDNTLTQPAGAFRSNQYIVANLIWRPIARVDVGVEYLHGERVNNDRQKGSADRIQFSVICRL